MTPPLPAPDPLLRPHTLVVARHMQASPSSIYRGWTEEFDGWFAAPGQIQMRAAVGEPYFFNTIHDGTNHPHYGRFLRLKHDRLVEMT